MFLPMMRGHTLLARLMSPRQEARENRRALEDARDEAEAAANIIAGQWAMLLPSYLYY